VGGMPLGALESSQYQATSVEIQEGDIVVFYSDGLVEAENEAEAYYGEGGLMKCLGQLKPQNADEILGAITADLKNFAARCRSPMT
jgi:phosphoserine phosphatase RsbU/P